MRIEECKGVLNVGTSVDRDEIGAHDAPHLSISRHALREDAANKVAISDDADHLDAIEHDERTDSRDLQDVRCFGHCLVSADANCRSP
jgi:hypothetical protein